MKKLDFTISEARGEGFPRILSYDNGGCHPASMNERDMWDRIKTLERENAEMREALEKISCPTQSHALLWWQMEARSALRDAKERKE